MQADLDHIVAQVDIVILLLQTIKREYELKQQEEAKKIPTIIDMPLGLTARIFQRYSRMNAEPSSAPKIKLLAGFNKRKTL